MIIYNKLLYVYSQKYSYMQIQLINCVIKVNNNSVEYYKYVNHNGLYHFKKTRLI